MKAVSEVIGQMLMLVIAVVLTALIASNLNLLIPDFHETVYADLYGRMNDGTINITHIGGEPLELSKVKLIVDGKTCFLENTTLSCNGRLFGDGDNFWEFGERLQINSSARSVLVVYDTQVVCKMYFGGWDGG